MHQRAHHGQAPPARNHSGSRSSESSWLTLTDLGRIYGISAVHCGRLLADAGLRNPEGDPTEKAFHGGCAIQRQKPQGHTPVRWHREHCHTAFAAAHLEPIQQATLVEQWVELLSALSEGSPSISTSAAQMAEELPSSLVEPVNAQLRQRGCSFQVMRRREERGTARPL